MIQKNHWKKMEHHCNSKLSLLSLESKREATIGLSLKSIESTTTTTTRVLQFRFCNTFQGFQSSRSFLHWQSTCATNLLDVCTRATYLWVSFKESYAQAKRSKWVKEKRQNYVLYSSHSQQLTRGEKEILKKKPKANNPQG